MAIGYFSYPFGFTRIGDFSWSKGKYGIKMLSPDRNDQTEMYRLAVLYIPDGAVIYTPTYCAPEDRVKRRASKAEVVAICSIHRDGESNMVVLKNKTNGKSIHTGYCGGCHYSIGSYVYPREDFSFDDKPCASGIHYFESVADLAESYLNEELYSGRDVIKDDDGCFVDIMPFTLDKEDTNEKFEVWFGACVEQHKNKRIRSADSCDCCRWRETNLRDEPCNSCKIDLNTFKFSHFERREGAPNE